MATDDSSGDGDGHMDGSGDGDGGVEGDLFFTVRCIFCIVQLVSHAFVK